MTVDSIEYARATVTSRLPGLVKGVGYRAIGGNQVLEDMDKIAPLALEAEKRLRATVRKSFADPYSVTKTISPDFVKNYGQFLMPTPQQVSWNSAWKNLEQTLSAELGKNISLTSPLSTGFVPFDLAAPTRLLYPGESTGLLKVILR